MSVETATDRHPVGARAFFVVWAGQLVSVTGTALTGFGLAVWVFLDTGSVTDLALMTLALTVPAVVLSPIAGAVVDRSDRRMVMLVADSTAGAATLGLALLFLAGSLRLWHVVLLGAVGSAANAFQNPAWLASVPLLVPKEKLGRANGLIQLNDALSFVIAPALAGALLATVGLEAVLFTDVATFVIGVATLAVVRFPRPEAVDDRTSPMVRQIRFAWRYLRDRPGLFWLLWVYGAVNFTLAFANVLLIPLVVSFSSEAAAGAVLSAAGFGGVIGSVAVSIWGGPKRRIRGIMAGIGATGLLVAAAGVRPSVVLVGVTAFLLLMVVPVVNTASQVVWQLKVPPAVQGRVFALRRMVAQTIAPVAILASGPLADGLFEPLMTVDGGLAGTVGRLIGVGPGRGIGLMFVVAGLATILVGMVGYGIPRVRRLESEIPDQVSATEE